MWYLEDGTTGQVGILVNLWICNVTASRQEALILLAVDSRLSHFKKKF